MASPGRGRSAAKICDYGRVRIGRAGIMQGLVLRRVRLKGRGTTGATAFPPLSTGITFAVTDKSFEDRIPIITGGYGRADSVDGTVFGWNFPLGGTYWDAADILVQHIAKKEGGYDKLK